MLSERGVAQRGVRCDGGVVVARRKGLRGRCVSLEQLLRHACVPLSHVLIPRADRVHFRLHTPIRRVERLQSGGLHNHLGLRMRTQPNTHSTSQRGERAERDNTTTLRRTSDGADWTAEVWSVRRVDAAPPQCGGAMVGVLLTLGSPSPLACTASPSRALASHMSRDRLAMHTPAVAAPNRSPCRRARRNIVEDEKRSGGDEAVNDRDTTSRLDREKMRSCVSCCCYLSRPFIHRAQHRCMSVCSLAAGSRACSDSSHVCLRVSLVHRWLERGVR